MIIAVNGVVCSGKTTICKALHELGFLVFHTSSFLPKDRNTLKLPAQDVVKIVEDRIKNTKYTYFTDSFPYDVEQLSLTKLQIKKAYILECEDSILRQRAKERNREDDKFFEERLKHMKQDIEELKKEYEKRNITYKVLKNENLRDLVENIYLILEETL
ncbi:MAG: AAA family ATPase [Thermodesulfovibrio sp.]|nr:AAA family ATPase [Thermodesulfovibrio sp.]